MRCPFCSAHDTRVVDTRLVDDGDQIKRRRECVACKERFTTFEVIELSLPRVIKRNGVRQTFDESKLRAGMQRALEKRPVHADAVELAISHIKKTLTSTGEREIASRDLGELVMQELQALDDVAFVRFASVYRSFEDVSEFTEMIKNLQKHDS